MTLPYNVYMKPPEASCSVLPLLITTLRTEDERPRGQEWRLTPRIRLGIFCLGIEPSTFLHLASHTPSRCGRQKQIATGPWWVKEGCRLDGGRPPLSNTTLRYYAKMPRSFLTKGTRLGDAFLGKW